MIELVRQDVLGVYWNLMTARIDEMKDQVPFVALRDHVWGTGLTLSARLRAAPFN